MERIIDLHVHSTCSDGVLTPQMLVDRAKVNGVSVLAIADHDSVEAYTDDLFEYADKNGVEIIKAVEMSTRYKGIGIHVLGYNFDLKNIKLIDTLSRLKSARQDYLVKVSEKLSSLGYVVNVNLLKTFSSVTKAHIASDVVSNEINNKLLLKTFGHIPSKGEFIETMMNENCVAYVEKFSISPIEASQIIHSAGGKVVLAHPVAYVHEDGVDVNWILDLVKDMKPDGIEANYLYVDRNNQHIDEVDFWRDFADKNNLFSTIGSDFHAPSEIQADLGHINRNLKLSDEQTQVILNNLKK